MSHRLDPNVVAPAAVQAIAQAYGYVQRSGLDPAVVDLVYLRVSQVNGCDPYVDILSRALVQRGIGLAKLLHLPFWEESDLFDERERAALAWAEAVTSAGETGVPQAAYESTRSHFGEKGLADLTVAIGLMNLSNRLAISFRSTRTGPRATIAHIRAR